jgi:glutathione S-transferase
MAMIYELYYWPEIQGRGEFIRLALEEAGAKYVDVARGSGKKLGMAAVSKLLDDAKMATPPFALPALRAGKIVIAQTANILLFLGGRHGLAPRPEAGKLWTHQLQLTMADFLAEIHDTHHPIASGLYYEDQRQEAKRRSREFLASRAPKFLSYFEDVLARNPGHKHLVGARLTYADLSLFQIVSGLNYAFPNAMRALGKTTPLTLALHERVAKRPRIAAYLASERRIAFNAMGIFRHYKELDE